MTAVAVVPTTAQARGDDANPLVELVDAATQRLQTAEPVAATKWINGGSIEDPPRVEQVLAAVSADATGKGVDPDFVRRMFTDQIHATEAIEYSGSRNGSSIRLRARPSRRTWRRRGRPSTG